ncbi:recombinase family protein [Pseudahrensia aquimaris]|uniref:Recombinase family protein n=1 Tax=Pseudahrensia aquimaris TaxID=744461 RepID=A0ABW3FGE1_9HYPH
MRRTKIRCAIYTRKSSEEGLEQEFNSLDAQREACEAYIASQKHEGWVLLKDHYDDGGLSGGTMDRPALQNLLNAVDDGLVDQIVVYKVDRLTRSLPDFSRLIERLDKAQASFVSVTQSFNTATSMGRLTLNVLLSFAQFEREVTAERIRDKIAASKKKGMWVGGPVPLGYLVKDRTLIAREDEAAIVRRIYDLYLKHGTIRETKAEADSLGLRSRRWTTRTGKDRGGLLFTRGHLYRILTNPIYTGLVHHKGATYKGQHDGIVDPAIWQRVQDQLSIAKLDRSTGADGEFDAAKDGQDRENAEGQELSFSFSSMSPTPHPSPARPKRSYRTDPSPLVGKVFDETGDRLTPSHANKKGKRYRYYISNRLIARSGEREAVDQEGPDRADNSYEGGKHKINNTTKPIGGWRLPAQALESVIADVVLDWLAGSTRPSELLIDGSADEQMRVQRQIATMRNAASTDDSPIVRLATLVERIDLWSGDGRSGKVIIRFDDRQMTNTLEIGVDRLNPDALVTSIPLNQRKRGVETRMILGHASPQIDTMLIRNLAQARSWYRELKDGSSLARIARTNNTTVSMVTRILPLAFLSSQVVEAICTGQHPPELTSRKLRDIVIPSDWDEQAKLFQLR